MERIRELIEVGVAKPGMRLPASRALSRQLSVSRNTVKNAYHNLMSQGYLSSSGTSGTFVSSKLPDKEISVAGHSLIQETGHNSFLDTHISTERPPSRAAGKIEFNTRGVNVALSPERTWRRLLIKHLPFQSRHAGNIHPAGLEMLRDAVANSISPLRGMSIRTENSVIVPDDYRAIDTISRLLTYRNKNVAVEDPCDAGLYYLLRSQGAQVTSIPVDDEGIVAKHLLKQNVSTVFVTPSHQQPTGVTMSLPRRLELLNWANTTGGHIVEWDTFGEFCYDDSPLPSLFSLDKADRVIYLNAFSSWIGSGAQLCYVVLPPGLVSQFLTIRSFLNPEPSWLDQRVAADFISSDSFFSHLRRIRQHFKQLRNILLETISETMGEQNLSGQQAGRHLVWHLPKAGLSSMEIQQLALTAGVAVPTLYDGYCSLGQTNDRFEPSRTILLGYSGINDEEVRSGVARLAAACDLGLKPVGHQ